MGQYLPLTLSGTEITDATRTAALSWTTAQSGGMTDGLTSPAGFGIWRAATNLFRRGQCDSTTDWSQSGSGTVTLSIDATVAAPFSPQSIKVVTDGSAANQGGKVLSATGQAAATGTICAASLWFKGVASSSYLVAARWANTDSTNTIGSITTFTATGAWQLLSPATVAVAAGETGDQLVCAVSVNGTRAETFHLAHGMLESGQFVVAPYVATSGGTTATHAGGRVQLPSSLLSAAQGWIALSLRVGFSSGVTPGQGFDWLFDWRNDGNNRLSLFYSEGAAAWFMRSDVASTVVDASSGTDTFAAGATRTVIGAWSAAGVQISLDGAPFVVSAATLPALTASRFDIGSLAGTGNWLCSDVLWVAGGTGTLTNADAATINAFSAAPSKGQFPVTARTKFTWSAVNGDADGPLYWLNINDGNGDLPYDAQTALKNWYKDSGRRHKGYLIKVSITDAVKKLLVGFVGGN